MNNHRNNNNNRRRGRSNNNNRNQGGANQANRIDSRARGNAPQLLDKYKKLAQDAYHNGDRVQQEYYLQFADHYHRVLADNKARQDEARSKRQEERGDSGDDQSDGDEDDNRNEGRGEGRSDRGNSRRPRGRRDERDDGGRGNDRNNDRSQERGRNRRPRDEEPSDGGEGISANEGVEVDEGSQGNETSTAPARKPRKPRARKPVAEGNEIDASALPPAIGESADEDEKPKRAPRRRRKISDDEAVEAVD